MKAEPQHSSPGRGVPIVSLPMYTQRPAALAAFWAGLRRHLVETGLDGAPASLASPADPLAHWTSPDLLMSQTCGYPLMHRLRGKVRYVGTPVYDAPGCDGALYRSVVVVRKDDPAHTVFALRGRRAAYNSTDSQSGCNALRALIAPMAEAGRFFAGAVETGSHANSLHAVRMGGADVASLDCVSFALLGRADPSAVADVRVLAQTRSAPGLPIITAAGTSDEVVSKLRAGWRSALADPRLAAHRAELMLTGFEALDPSAYEVIPRMEAEAKAQGYPRLS